MDRSQPLPGPSGLLGILVKYRFGAIAFANLVLAAVAYAGAFLLRFDFSLPAGFGELMLQTLPLLCACKFIGFWRFGLFSGWWRHVSVRDTEDILKASVTGSLLFFVAVAATMGIQGFPRSIFLTDFVLCTALVAGARVAIRLLWERDRSGPRRIERQGLIVGAGEAGIRLLGELQSRPSGDMEIVGFVDDDPSKQGMRICGVPVLGPIDRLASLADGLDISEVLIAIPSARSSVMRRAAERCREAGLRARVLPSLGELVEGKFMFAQMREVRVEDLLGREPVRLDNPRLRSFVEGRRVLVTGAAGSIGSELCRQIAANGPSELVLFDRHENGIFIVEAELRQKYPDLKPIPVLGDVLLGDQLEAVFRRHEPHVVFHAAAFKHVPLAEQNVVETVRNNVIGTRNLLDVAEATSVDLFVFISTDKAVRPTSVMGATKRVAEMLVRARSGGATRFVAVRFGNVLGSSGSVVPLFRDQIARGGPVTVTDPEVTRFFMTIPEAVALVLQAATLAESGDTLVLEMGRPVRILDLARQMIELSGFLPGDDIEIQFTGLRHGEKLHEELVDDGERLVATAIDRISRLETAPAPAGMAGALEAVERGVRAQDAEALIEQIKLLVPTYSPSPGGRQASQGLFDGPPPGITHAPGRRSSS